jgi:diguanylate cyclase (GGDEF)-like protein
MNDNKLQDEEGRLLALGRYGLLDTPPDSKMDAITSLIREVLGVDICGVSLIDADRQWLKSIAGTTELKQSARKDSFCQFTIQARSPFVVEDAHSDVRFVDNPLVTGSPFIRSYAGVPLTSPDGYNLGALCVIDPKPRGFASSELALLQRFSGLVVDQMEMHTLAQRDSLTNALTRRAFAEGGRRIFAESERNQQPSALIMLDIDHFKGINDRFGHPVGDSVLTAVSAQCCSELRQSDLLGRIGGEEFAVVLANMREDAAMACAERLRSGIEGMRNRYCPSVTASFGVAPFRPGTDFDLAMAEADAALYAAKRRGRNRCVTSSSAFGLAA